MSGYIQGLQEYLNKNYNTSIFDQLLASGNLWEFHLHGFHSVCGAIIENRRYDLVMDIPGKGKEEIPKIQVKFLHPAGLSESVKPLLKSDQKVKDMGLDPILSLRKRYFVKNKSLFPLMQEKEVLFFTLLEGDVIRGVVIGFSRYEITLHLKGGLPVTILRHSIHNLRNKKGRSFLKPFQEEHRDWEKSPLFIFQQPGEEGKKGPPL